jgi:hypothetical protein
MSCIDASVQIVRPLLIFSVSVQVSKSWNVLALDGSNWQKVDFFEFQVDVDSGVVENLARRCGGFLKVLSLSGCQVRASFPKGIVARDEYFLRRS